jgi:hypothetical protein
MALALTDRVGFLILVYRRLWLFTRKCGATVSQSGSNPVYACRFWMSKTPAASGILLNQLSLDDQEADSARMTAHPDSTLRILGFGDSFRT